MGTHPIFESDFDCLTDFKIGTDQRMVTGPIANEQCEPQTNSPTVVADQAPVDAVSDYEVFLADGLLASEDSSRVAPSVEALACGLAMSSRNFNNNSNSTSVAADQAPGDDEEGVEGGEAEAVEAEQAPAEADAAEEQAEGAADDVSSMYSESIATVRTGASDEDAMSTVTEGSEWGDEFAPWELQVKANEFTVRDLVTMKKEYQFRVVAVNAAGRSKPSKASDVIQPRPDQKRPTPPRALRNIGTTPNSIALQWEEPEDNGGADILGYAVQLRAGRSKQWKEVAVDLKELSYNVTDLTEGMDYVFRVHCYNIVGVSDWHENLEPVRAKPMYDPPGVPC